MIQAKPAAPKLTKRRQEVFNLLLQGDAFGKTLSEIGEILGIRTASARTHVNDLRQILSSTDFELIRVSRYKIIRKAGAKK